MRGALESVPGVRNVEVSFEKAEAYVEVEKDKFDPAALVKALEDAGYKGSVKETARSTNDRDGATSPTR